MRKLIVFFFSLFLLSISSYAQQQRVKKVLFQGFWWDYWNNNFSNKWSDYLTELSPRLKAAGIDAVWIPPTAKGGNTGSVGYNVFDQYDLGDKFQKGGGVLNVRTRMGNKDELLRMIAVMHANGMEVIQDVVLNHTNEAGTNNGTGGRDPQSPFSIANANGFKNFRYVSYATPLLDESQNDYWTRNGRWPKNYTNFYPNANNNCTTGDICSPFFGPDMSYESNAIGISSNIPTTGTATIGTIRRAFVNPVQPSNYMRNEARNWLMWYKKQTGVDGWRWDAVKHFPVYVQEDLIFNTKYNLPAFARGGESMLCIGEWIGNKAELDNYVMAVKSGNELHTGTFDFSLRGYSPSGGIYGMVLSQGAFDMQALPGEQQFYRYYDYATQRVHRTIPFVNSHDTYRPILSSNGDFIKPLGDATGWNTGSELGGNGQHIDPREPRLYAAYATVFAMDGNPTVFFEDLFDIGTTGKRFSHLPTSSTDLPIRPDIQNIILAHQKLEFKNGDYAVPTSLTGADAPFYLKGSSGDHLVIERRGKALIGITDRFATATDNTQDEEVWVTVSDTSWRNRELIDYSGAHGLTTSRVYADGRVLVKTAPVGHTISGALGHGYSVWAPIPNGVTFNSVNDLYAYLSTYAPARNPATTQEWEMADDLGDSHVNSLRQGGQLPLNSTAQRTAGAIFAEAGKPISVQLFPQVSGGTQQISIHNSANTAVATRSGTSSSTAPLTLSFTPTVTGWYQVRVNSTTNKQPAQRVWVNVTYTAPSSVNTRQPALRLANPIHSEANPLLVENQSTITVYPNPGKGSIRIDPGFVRFDALIKASLYDTNGRLIGTVHNTLNAVEKGVSNLLQDKVAGLYVIRLTHSGKDFLIKYLKQ
ncbi:MAG: T9SS type A sorting domain-containing protein [Bacteroidetes bacterium]|nr:T9SS type A sorting domain-containing protein [Bacteroidota bacterium]